MPIVYHARWFSGWHGTIQSRHKFLFTYTRLDGPMLFRISPGLEHLIICYVIFSWMLCYILMNVMLYSHECYWDMWYIYGAINDLNMRCDNWWVREYNIWNEWLTIDMTIDLTFDMTMDECLLNIYVNNEMKPVN